MPIIDSMPAGGMIFDSNTPGFLGPAVINSYTVLAIPAYWRAMQFIANNMASFPRFVAKQGVETKHRLTPLLARRPNGFQNSSTFWRTLFFHRAHTGNGFAEIIRDTQFNAKALFPHTPENVLPFRFLDDASGDTLTFYHCGKENGRDAKIVASADMLHLTSLSYDGLSGLNPIVMLNESFERARHVDRFLTRFLIKGTVVKGAIEIPSGLSKEQQTDLINTIQTNFRGSNAERDILVLSDGAKFSNSTMTAQESNLIGIASYTTKQVSMATGVDPAFLFDLSESKYNGNVEQAGEQAVRYLFRPMLEADEAELSLKLLSDAEAAAGYSIKFDPDALIRGDTSTTSTVTIAQVNAGVISKNEGREALGYGPSTDPDADKLQTLGSTTPPQTPPAKTATPSI